MFDASEFTPQNSPLKICSIPIQRLGAADTMYGVATVMRDDLPMLRQLLVEHGLDAYVASVDKLRYAKHPMLKCEMGVPLSAEAFWDAYLTFRTGAIQP